MPKMSASSFSKSLRFQFVALSVIFWLSFFTFFLGWGQMRYSSTTIIPIEKLVFWRFALAGVLPALGYGITALFIVNLLMSQMSNKTRNVRFISWMHIGVCGAALVWGLIFAAWEITAWTECNDPGPKHPECRNREYPAETIADYSFIMMVIASGVMTLCMAWALYFNSMVAVQSSVVDVNIRADMQYPVGSRYGDLEKQKHHKKHHHHDKHSREHIEFYQGVE